VTTASGSSDWFARARTVIPGGVNSPVRAFGAVGGDPYFTASAAGATLTTTDGRELLDYVQSWGASILGHAHPKVVEAVQAAAADGTSYGTPTQREVLLAEAIVERVPSVEQVRLVSSGTEAGMSALRLARGATGRTKLVKFAGHYHGHSDALLAAAGSGLMTFGLPASAGVTPGAVADTIVLPWNDVAAVDAAFAEAGADIAVVACEPVAANMGVVPPAPGFLEHLRATCDRHGALLLFDEVITGFRLGLAGAQGHYGVTPDLSCFGKVVGGGLPLAAFGGRADLMAELAPVGPVYQAGTLSGNPLATAAGLAVLAELDAGCYDELATRTARLADGLAAAFATAGVPVQVPRVATLCGLFLVDGPVVDQVSASACDTAGYARFFHAMLDAGIAFAPSAFEALFVSLAHTDADIDRTVDVAAAAALLVAAR
jgi:glutamate-1-semialdehyde 2,1-aminomutase